MAASFSRRFLPFFLFLALAVRAVCPEEVVKVGAYRNPPEVYMGSNGKVAGIFPDVLEDIAAGNGWSLEYVYGTWNECLERLENGEIDLLVDVAVTEEAGQHYEVSSETVLANWGAAYSRNDMAIESLFDLEGRTVAVLEGSIHYEGDQGIKALMSRFGVSCSFLEVDSYRQVLLLVDSKQADAGIVNRLYGQLFSEDFDVSPTPVVFNPLEMRFAAPKDSARGKGLLGKIDRSLSVSKGDPRSVYGDILDIYLGTIDGEWTEGTPYPPRELELSPAEERWIEEHHTIRFGMDPEFAPFEFLSPEGEYRGISADFLNHVGRETGLDFRLVSYGSWSETVQAAKEREIDLLPAVGYSGERTGFLAYSRAYQEFSRVIVASSDSEVLGLADLAGKSVGVQADSSHHAYLRETAGIDPVLFPTYEESLLALSRGELDGVIGNLAVTTHVIRKLALTNVKMAAYADPSPQSLAFGVRDDWPELVTIIDKVLDRMTLKQRNAILARWIPLPKAASEDLDLTREEREWLLMHSRIRVGWDPSWAPVEFSGSRGTPRGISMEYLDAVEKILGVEFLMGEPEDWQTTYQRLNAGDLDMSTCLTITPERLDRLSFSEPYISSPVVIFGREGFPYIRDISEIAGFRVAVVEDYATDEWLSRDFPELGLIRASSFPDALKLVNRGKADLFIGSVLTGNYYLSELRFWNLSIVGETPYVYKLRMAVRKDWPLFAGILNKALAALPMVDRTAFYRKWVWVKYERGFDYVLLGKIALASALVILFFAYWNRKLAREIRARKEAQSALEAREKALRDSYWELKKLEELKDNLTHMIVHDIRSPLMSIAGALDLMEDEGGVRRDRLIEMARGETERLTGMAQDLLDISRMEAGRMPLSPVSLRIQSVAESALRTMNIQAGMAGVKLLLGGEDSYVRADPDILLRVLVNLIGNAVKASSEGMEVEIITAGDPSWITVEVRDRGCGIPEEFQKTLFEKFSTARSEGKRKVSVGLGLTFCKLAVEAHGGEISVTSREGQGSIFCVRLPGTREEP